jgi:hypothetical protein
MTAGFQPVTETVASAPRTKSVSAGAVKTIAFCLLGLAVNAFLFGPSLQLTARGVNDFMSIYSGTRLAFTDNMYNIGENLRVQREAAGWDNINHLFLRPPFDALLMWPLGRLSYITAAHLWELLIVASVALFCYFWPGNRRAAAIACCWSFPLFHVFANGQDIALILLLIAIGLREMRRGRETTAGMIFALCSIKFHLLLLLPVLIIGQRRWKLLGGLMAGGALLFAVSFLPGGSHWVGRYLALLRNPIGNPWPEAMPNLHGLTDGLSHAAIWQAAGSLAVAILVFWVSRNKSFEFGLAAVLVGSILVAPHAYLSDIALALPALLITLPMVSGVQRSFQIFLLSPACTLWAMIHPTWITTLTLIGYLVMLALSVHFTRSFWQDRDQDAPPVR